ncbi:hypothetical protein LELG_04244 [Lodderomyces elongisporus NRRL YB-4239]|uniref:Uncharacterized protein n=1 Tax=Lodderomyces elongisporus (strain ATCC 11503 / CBS 2605 / JCM 1781 / NBRC 1676 / NRRL YB-4239) TaxID=379508 RepID=A5E3Q6_LODEL|nr:hypothetical protein LELG_04244 [Lodderomyces elongisporus NRRL YB-4239]
MKNNDVVDYASLLGGYEEEEGDVNSKETEKEKEKEKDSKKQEGKNQFNDAESSFVTNQELQDSRYTQNELASGNYDTQSIQSSSSFTFNEPPIDANTARKSGATTKYENDNNNDNSNNNEDDIASRRVLQSTLNFGNWVPNTDSFRNQFINNNDNESTANSDFTTTLPSSSQKGYNKFTNVRNPSGLSEVVSNASSSESLPDTIDVAMPVIEEDLDNDCRDRYGDKHGHDEHYNDEEGGKEEGKEKEEEKEEGDDDEEDEDNDFHDSLSNHRLNTMVTQDSILETKAYPSALFKEEKLTPAASRESLPQKYSSLVGNELVLASRNTLDTLTVPKTRNFSNTSESTTVLSSGATTTGGGDGSGLAVGAGAGDGSGSANTTSNSIPTITTTTATTSTPAPVAHGSGQFKRAKYPVSDWKAIVTISQPVERIAAFKDALGKEAEYDTGLQTWLNHALKQSQDFNNIHIGRIASEAYQNAQHNDLRRHVSFRSTVNVVKDKVEGTGSTASNFGKKLFSRSKKFISGGDK